MILPGMGRGTIRRMVEGQARLFRNPNVMSSRVCPSTVFDGPPPPMGED